MLKSFYDYRLRFCDACFYIWEQEWMVSVCPRCQHTLSMMYPMPEEFSRRFDTVETPYAWRLIVGELHAYMLENFGSNINNKWRQPLAWLGY